MSAVLLPHRPRGLRLLVALAGGTLLAACGSDQDLPLAPDVQLPAVEARAPFDVVPLSAPYLVDQDNSRFSLARPTVAIYPAPSVGQIVRQTVTQGRTGLLGYLELPVACRTGTLLNVRITDAKGTRIRYETNVIVPSSFDGRLSTIQLFDPAVSSGISLIRGQVWAFELRAFAGPVTPSGVACALARETIDNSYARGSLFTWDDSNPFFPDRGWRLRSGNDLTFRTLVR